MSVLALLTACSSGDQHKAPVSERASSAPTVTGAPATPAQPEPVPEPEPVTVELDTDTHFALCGGKVQDLADVLQPIVADLVAQKIPYSRTAKKEWRDCSGNFLRLSSAVAAVCDEHASELLAPAGVKPYVAGGDNVIAFDVPVRSSRATAKWYAQRGRLTPIYYDDAPGLADVPNDLLKHRSMIRPGAVVWFSRGRPESSLGLDQLFASPDTPNNINHMATVTAVTRDDQGDVISYEMYHGHGKEAKGTKASVTTKQFFEYPASYLKNGTVSYPPLGYWSQRLVAIGTLVPTVEAMVVP